MKPTMLKKRLHIKTSGYCNNNCIFCCDRIPDMPKEGNSSHFDSPGLNLKKFKESCKRISSIDSMLFTCGEPTLNKRLSVFIALAKKLGYKSIGIQTNGRLLGYKDFCLNLIEAGATEFGVSIHGSNRLIHESLTRTPGGFAQTYSGLENLVALKDKYNIKIGVSTTLTKLNYKDIYNILKMLLVLEKIDSFALNTLMYSNNAYKFFNQIYVSYTDVADELKQAIDKLALTGSDKAALLIKIQPMPYCLMLKYENFVGRQEVPIEFKKDLPKVLCRGSSLTKNKFCQKCKFYKICSGIDTVYASRIGWREFHPVT